MLFSGHEGHLGLGASGYFLTEPFQVNVGKHGRHPNSRGGDGINWKRITGYEMTNFGTGYTKMPAVFATSGITGLHLSAGDSYVPWTTGYTTATDPNGYGSGYDVAYSEDVFVYRKFQAYTEGNSLAAGLTGIPYFVESGNGIYGLSGIIITNPGSGYGPTYQPPDIWITRTADDPLGTRGTCSETQYPTQAFCEGAGTCSDTQYNGDKWACENAGTCDDEELLTKEDCEDDGETWTPANNTWTSAPEVWTDGGDNLSGEFFFNKEGRTYDFGETWNVETGMFAAGVKIGADFKENNYLSNNKYSHMTWFAPEDEEFYVTVKFNNLDVDQDIQSRLVISGTGQILEVPLSIANNYTFYSGLGWVPPGVFASADGTSFIASYFGGS